MCSRSDLYTRRGVNALQKESPDPLSSLGLRAPVGITSGIPISMGHKLTLLQIDDNPDDRFFFKEAIALTGTPFEYREADSMESAVSYFQSHPEGHPRPDLVILDYRLGRHTGLDFLYWLRSLRNETSVTTAIMSGVPGGQNADQFYAAGANYFLTKPVSLERLKTVIRTLHMGLVSKRQPGIVVLLKEYAPRPDA